MEDGNLEWKRRKQGRGMRERRKGGMKKRKEGFQSHSHSLARGSVSQKATFPKLLCSLDSWPKGGPNRKLECGRRGESRVTPRGIIP